MRVGVRQALYLGGRTLLAATCRVCGELHHGHEFPRRGDGYIDRRGRRCKWWQAEQSLGR